MDKSPWLIIVQWLWSPAQCNFPPPCGTSPPSSDQTSDALPSICHPSDAKCKMRNASCKLGAGSSKGGCASQNRNAFAFCIKLATFRPAGRIRNRALSTVLCAIKRLANRPRLALTLALTNWPRVSRPAVRGCVNRHGHLLPLFHMPPCHTLLPLNGNPTNYGIKWAAERRHS